MKNNWLWDRKLSIPDVKRILKSPQNRQFLLLASLLLARNNKPSEVFNRYLDPLIFCQQWLLIKKRMRENKWNEPRIIFWQAIYENLMDRFRKQGISFRKESPLAKAGICKEMGELIRNRRKQLGLSQKDIAEKMGISQQLISRFEKGKENVSLLTLKGISEALGADLMIDLKER
jgi:DNA-binding XRE family transcriptional regulator